MKERKFLDLSSFKAIADGAGSYEGYATVWAS